MIFNKKIALVTILTLGVSSYSTIYSSEPFSFIHESQDDHPVSPALKNTGYGFGSLIPENEDENGPQNTVNLKTTLDQEDIQSVATLQNNELKFFDSSLKPSNTMVSRNISLEAVERARYMSEISYEGSQLKPVRIKARELVEEHEKIIKANSDLSEEIIRQKALSSASFLWRK